MELNLKIPQNIVVALKLPEKEIGKTLQIELALTLYQRNILSFGKAREFSGLTKWEFHELLGDHKIERHYDEENLLEDIQYGKSSNHQ